MKRKAKIDPAFSREWRSFGLSREVSISFWNYVQIDIPENYESLRLKRDQGGRGFKHKKAFTDNAGNAHLFLFVFDDETSADHLILTYLQHIPRQK